MEHRDPSLHQLHFGLRAIKMFVILMAFVGVTFLLVGNASSSVESTISHYQAQSEAQAKAQTEMFKILEN